MDKLTSYQNTAFTIFIILSYVLYGLFAVGLSQNAPKYLDTLDYYVKIYISLFLLWRFNMFRKVEFTELDRKIAFSAGLFVFTTTALNGALVSYFGRLTT
jgi:cytochrome c biogenesis protein CcdA